ncbi:hypothetical protein HY417_03770 [Candidatus Kaiserbacteria bacterium]|nr:hypothetical protein [Candidatus Kaiserbacteria bacterium]
MQIKLVVAIVVLISVAALGPVLVAWPTPSFSPTPDSAPTPTPAPKEFVTESVIVSDPLPNASVPHTFTVEGRARGTWFFEASFPVQVRDAGNNPVGLGLAQTADDWMTTEFVPFAAVVTVSGYSGPARLILMKDNPSGLPEFEDAVEFDIVIQ